MPLSLVNSEADEVIKMSEWLDEPLAYAVSMPELMTARDIIYLAEDIVTDNNIQAVYKPAELNLEVV